MRVLQGLALGGEYGGAATYIAEHAPDGRRGFYTCWIQTTATMGIVLALLVILDLPPRLRRPGVRRLGLARAVPDLGDPRRAVGLHPAEARRIAALSPGSRSRARRRPTRRRELSSSGKNWGLMLIALFGATAPEGRRLVHGPVLRAVLHDRRC